MTREDARRSAQDASSFLGAEMRARGGSGKGRLITRSPLAGQLILQAPHPIFEGDNVTLKCRGRGEKFTEKKVYYKGGEKLRRGEVSTSDSDSITLRSVSRDSSLYHCTTTTATTSFWNLFGQQELTSNHLRIQVQGNGCTPAGCGAWQGNSVWGPTGVPFPWKASCGPGGVGGGGQWVSLS